MLITKLFLGGLFRLRSVLFFSYLLFSARVLATGMQPETSLLLIHAAEQGGVMNVKNTDNYPALLYTRIQNLPDEAEGVTLLVTQPVVRVEAGHTQQVRFILKTAAPLVQQHLMRVTFEGIPPKTPGSHKVGITIRQDLPVLIHPATLPEVQDAWTRLQWRRDHTRLQVTNPSPYVVRLASQVMTLPSRAQADLGKSYILPGQTLTLQMNKSPAADRQVRIAPVSRYGVAMPEYVAALD
ncbi:fimbria/pilus chaperone family protein [Erwiniaceae bacterium BAC15a-03b]|uniref:Fimbria/pilus chaperone family protein n=1 Tax=Winslowiella arboricola TaxID=2978220 RepID=A0A9J6PYS6_9GAMM|nr:fimbria/pilus chaperone family protein [Winslowiella arboricola]MCU5772972.1 fimbria/pilus chaperone family protein [Winslowiella arboricola]MCU5780600.1 fimbria/pilus chaperone family protein [Winslowiella arboricola]